MAFSSPLTRKTSNSGGRSQAFIYTFTECGTSDQIVITGVPNIGRINRLRCTRTGGSANMTVVVSKSSTISAANTIFQQSGAASSYDTNSNGGNIGWSYETTNNTLYVQPTFASGSDNAGVLEIHITQECSA